MECNVNVAMGIKGCCDERQKESALLGARTKVDFDQNNLENFDRNK